MPTIQAPQPETSKIVRAVEIQVELPSPPVRYYRHGWQTWSLAAWTDLSPLPVQKPSRYHVLQVDAEYALEKDPHGSWLGAVELADGSVVLLGALGLDAHVFLSGGCLVGRGAAGEIDWFCARGPERPVFAQYAGCLGDRLGRTRQGSPPRVWCSWYSLYTMIDELILDKIFAGLGDLPFDVLQVDDGWQVAAGDWRANARFPSGMAALAARIRSTGRRAGLWLAPLLVAPSSALCRDHPDWLLRDERGRFVSAGFNWGENLYALDTTHPEAAQWLADLMRQVRAWGFDYIKLDFLYAGALRGKRYHQMPREAAFREAVQGMRAAMGEDAYFLTCGTPILPVLGLCDAIRIGPDVSGDWEGELYARYFSNLSAPGVKNAIRTVLGRLWLEPLLHLDPDVAFFTETANSLSPAQKRLLQDLALVAGYKATSELPQWLSAPDREAVRQFLTASPKVAQVDRTVFTLDDRRVDFSPALSLPPAPRGLTALIAAFLGWLGSQDFALKIARKFEDDGYRKRRASLDM